MLGFATAIDAERVLLEKRHICPNYEVFWYVYRSTQPTDLFSRSRYN